MEIFFLCGTGSSEHLIIHAVDQLQYGLDVLDNSKDESLSFQLKIPFDKTVKTDY
jgi:hypothetical protein